MKLTDRLTAIASDLLSVICPDVCTVCSTPLVRGEKVMCLKCLAEMPLTGCHSEKFSVLHERTLSTAAPVDKAAAMMWYYRESPYATLIHDAKYRARPKVAEHLARTYARTLMREGFFDGVDILLPVPMHWLKVMRRGYNQAEVIARAISAETGIAVGDNLVCRRPHSTQTRKNAAERYENARDTYGVVHPEELHDRGIVIVDDVLTTGATIRACLERIHEAAPAARLSFLTLAATRLRE